MFKIPNRPAVRRMRVLFKQGDVSRAAYRRFIASVLGF